MNHRPRQVASPGDANHGSDVMSSLAESVAGITVPMGTRAGRASRLGASLRAGVPAGALATLTMDAAMVAAGRIGGRAFMSDRVGPGMIGRWAAGLVRGRLHREEITREPAVRGEVALGIVTHYLTGIVLTQAYLVAQRRGAKPTLRGATGYGIATAVLPLLVLYPSLGYGWFGLRSGEAARLDRIMLLGHTAFGLGIGIWAPVFLGRGASRAGFAPSN